MPEPLISVIIPIYKVEKWLDKSVRSILHQTYQNLEIILVDDGSPDQCPSMCDEYAKEDIRVRVIHKPNGGLSDARNSGTSIATGEYIMFLDSDDWVAPDIIYLLYRLMVRHGADISECSLTYVDYDYYKPKTTCTGEVIIATQLQSLRMLNDFNRFLPIAVAKLIKKEVMNNISFPFGKMHEDEFTIYKYHLNSSKLIYTDVSKYYYNQHASSMMSSPYSIHRLDSCEAYSERLRIFFELGLSDLWEQMANKYCWLICHSLQQCIQYQIPGISSEATVERAINDYHSICAHGIRLHVRYIESMQSLEQGSLEAFRNLCKKKNYVFQPAK